MRLGPGSHPRAEEGLGGVRSGDSNELVSRLTERTIRTSKSTKGLTRLGDYRYTNYRTL